MELDPEEKGRELTSNKTCGLSILKHRIINHRIYCGSKKKNLTNQRRDSCLEKIIAEQNRGIISIHQ
jgi:hypothetical protein